MLLKIREKIQQDREVSMQQLVREFHADEQALEPMLDFWIRKGIIQKIDGQSGCRSKCFGCGPKGNTYYQARTRN